ncbi:hypothetical protein LEN26_020630 [Aphanomyces euteiches]|nr:hypothetical protein LEN26_020630 [Aphanomyces euteiches]
MSQRKEHPIELRLRVLSKHKQGFGYKRIAKELDMAPSSVRNIVIMFKTEGRTTVSPRSGRGRSTTVYVDRLIHREALKDRRASTPTIAKGLEIFHDVIVSEETVRRRLRDFGLNGRAARKKPFISKANRLKRLAFAKKHLLWSPEDWKRVLFSDESPFNLTGSNGRIYVWRRPGEEFKDICLQPTFKSGRQTVMVWGAINFNGVGTLRFCDGKMKSEDYKCLLEDELGDNAAKLDLPLDFVFQHDNAPIHKAALVSKFLDENMIEALDHPPKAQT